MSRTTEITTGRQLLGVYAAASSARVLVGMAVTLLVARLLLAATGHGFGISDLLVPVATVAMTGVVEWVVHKYLLHGSVDSWSTRVLRTGIGHRRHHADPTDLEWVLLGGTHAVLFAACFGVFTASWSVPALLLTGSSLLGPFLTAWTCAVVGMAHYELVHLMVHTRYRPRLPYYQALERNHRLHHYRNENYWFGITSITGDRLLGTLRDKHDVPVSDSVRTLA